MTGRIFSKQEGQGHSCSESALPLFPVQQEVFGLISQQAATYKWKLSHHINHAAICKQSFVIYVKTIKQNLHSMTWNQPNDPSKYSHFCKRDDQEIHLRAEMKIQSHSNWSVAAHHCVFHYWPKANPVLPVHLSDHHWQPNKHMQARTGAKTAGTRWSCTDWK